MNNKIIELAYLRNQLASKKYSDEDEQMINKVKHDISKMNSPFKELALHAINNCENDIKNANFDLATQEMQLIHNFPFYDPEIWDSDYFYKIELLSYLEQVEDVTRIKKLICSLAKLQQMLS